MVCLASGRTTPLNIPLDGRASEIVLALVSLVSVLARNWFYSCAKVERVETGETVEIASVHAGFVQVAENMLG